MFAVSLDRFAYGLADPQEQEPAVLGLCACGCGEEITDGYVYFEKDGIICVDADHALIYEGWREVG